MCYITQDFDLEKRGVSRYRRCENCNSNSARIIPTRNGSDIVNMYKFRPIFKKNR